MRNFKISFFCDKHNFGLGPIYIKTIYVTPIYKKSHIVWKFKNKLIKDLYRLQTSCIFYFLKCVPLIKIEVINKNKERIGPRRLNYFRIHRKYSHESTKSDAILKSKKRSRPIILLLRILFISEMILCKATRMIRPESVLTIISHHKRA